MQIFNTYASLYDLGVVIRASRARNGNRTFRKIQGINPLILLLVDLKRIRIHTAGLSLL